MWRLYTNPYWYKRGMQANTASVMHGRFQRHSPTDIWAAIQTRSICGLNVKCLPHTQVLLGPQAVVLSGRLWKHCNLGVNWLPWPWGGSLGLTTWPPSASNLLPVPCSLYFAPACFCCHAIPARRGLWLLKCDQNRPLLYEQFLSGVLSWQQKKSIQYFKKMSLLA